MYKYWKLVISLVIVGLFCLGGCIGKDQNGKPMDFTMQIDDTGKDVSISSNDADSDTNEKELWYSIGARIKGISMIQGIDDPAILVNGYSITKKEIETQKILKDAPNSSSLKENINLMIRAKVVWAEAIRLGIQPSQDRINAYVEQSKEGLGEGTPEMILSYIEGMGITQEEYLAMLEKAAYEMFQKEALWTFVESSQKDKDYERYVDGLVKKANIEILDPDIKKLLSHN